MDHFICECKYIVYFEHIPKEIEKIIENQSTITNCYRIQGCDWIMCGYVCVEFIYFMLKDKSFFDYTNLFSSNSCENNDEIILKYFQN